ncbi:hypothetical protein [Kitasatospora albolonga]|uniref:hypothetical protein n=1 Tax=Kitasatospora albolonga TaxID=68173 RepID=UPI0035ED066F
MRSVSGRAATARSSTSTREAEAVAAAWASASAWPVLASPPVSPSRSATAVGGSGSKGSGHDGSRRASPTSYGNSTTPGPAGASSPRAAAHATVGSPEPSGGKRYLANGPVSSERKYPLLSRGEPSPGAASEPSSRTTASGAPATTSRTVAGSRSSATTPRCASSRLRAGPSPNESSTSRTWAAR